MQLLLIGYLALGQPIEFAGVYCHSRAAAVEVVNKFHVSTADGIAAVNEHKHCGQTVVRMVPRQVVSRVKLDSGHTLTVVASQTQRGMTYLITTSEVYSRPSMEV